MNYTLRILQRTLPSSISQDRDRTRHYWVLENSRGDFICRSFNGRCRGANWGYKHKSTAITSARRFMGQCLGAHYVRVVEGYYPDDKGKLIDGKNLTKRRKAKKKETPESKRGKSRARRIMRTPMHVPLLLIMACLLNLFISGCVKENNVYNGTYQRAPARYYRTYTLPSGRTLIEELPN